MKNTGIVRKLDDLGRIVIPKELRTEKKIAEGDAVEIFTEGDLIILRKYAPGCSFCKNEETETINGIRICDECIAKIKRF